MAMATSSPSWAHASAALLSPSQPRPAITSLLTSQPRYGKRLESRGLTAVVAHPRKQILKTIRKPGINISDYDGLRAGLPIMSSVVMPCTQTSVRPNSKGSIHINAAWTRRSKGEGPKTSRKSWKQRTEKYMKPFMLDIFISARYIHAKVVHRVTSKVISVATTNAKDLRFSLPSLIDVNACKVIGKLIAERSLDADVYAVTYELRKGEKLEGKLALVLESVRENGVAIV